MKFYLIGQFGDFRFLPRLIPFFWRVLGCLAMRHTGVFGLRILNYALWVLEDGGFDPLFNFYTCILGVEFCQVVQCGHCRFLPISFPFLLSSLRLFRDVPHWRSRYLNYALWTFKICQFSPSFKFLLVYSINLDSLKMIDSCQYYFFTFWRVLGFLAMRHTGVFRLRFLNYALWVS